MRSKYMTTLYAISSIKYIPINSNIVIIPLNEPHIIINEKITSNKIHIIWQIEIVIIY